MKLFLPFASPRVVLWQTAQSLAKISDGGLPWSILVWARAIAGIMAKAATMPTMGARRRNKLTSSSLFGLTIILNPKPAGCERRMAGRPGRQVHALLVDEDFVLMTATEKTLSAQQAD